MTEPAFLKEAMGCMIILSGLKIYALDTLCFKPCHGIFKKTASDSFSATLLTDKHVTHHSKRLVTIFLDVRHTESYNDTIRINSLPHMGIFRILYM